MAGSIRERLAIAVSQLKEAGHHDSAAAVQSVAAPRGYLLLKKGEERESSSSLTITMNKALREALADAGEEFGVVFSGLAEEAYRKVRDEGWVPPKPVRGEGGPKAVLNVVVDDGLRRQVREMLPGLSEEAGFRVAEGNLVLSHICDELGIERRGTGDLDRLTTRAPKGLVDHLNREAEARGLSLQEIVEDGIRGLLDGSWTPERHPYYTAEKRGVRTSSWSEADRARLSVKVDAELLAGLRKKADELSGRSGFPTAHPGSIVRAILTDRLGWPAE